MPAQSLLNPPHGLILWYHMKLACCPSASPNSIASSWGFDLCGRSQACYQLPSFCRWLSCYIPHGDGHRHWHPYRAQLCSMLHDGRRSSLIDYVLAQLVAATLSMVFGKSLVRGKPSCVSKVSPSTSGQPQLVATSGTCKAALVPTTTAEGPAAPSCSPPTLASVLVPQHPSLSLERFRSAGHLPMPTLFSIALSMSNVQLQFLDVLVTQALFESIEAKLGTYCFRTMHSFCYLLLQHTYICRSVT